jgi:hypothetical protein
MPYKLTWYLSERILLAECEGTMTTDEVRDFARRGVEMVSTGKPLVHFIIDFRLLEGVESIPQALRALQQNPPHPDMGWVVVVGMLNPAPKLFMDMAAMVLRMRYQRCDTLDRARAFLKERDTSLAGVL